MIGAFCLFLSIWNGLNTEANFRARAHTTLEEYSTEDVATETQVGKSLAARILHSQKLVENEKAQKYLNSLGSYVVSKIGRPEIEYFFGLLDSEEVNAYAAPGGYVFVTKGALKKAGSEVALLGVLGHEIGHINERHAVKALKIRASNMFFQLSGSLGGAQTYLSFLETTVGKGFDLLFEKGLSPSDEFSADRYAATFLAAEGINPQLFSDFLQKLHKDSKASLSILRKTHPPLSERIQELEIFKLQFGPVESVRTISETRYKDIASQL